LDITNLVYDVAYAVANDPTLKAWSQTNFDRDHSVFIDVDIRELPGESYAPYVVITGLDKSVDQERRTKEHYLGFLCFVYKDAQPIQLLDNLFRFEGNSLVEAFRKYIENVIDATVADLISVEVSTDSISHFPFIQSEMVVGVREHMCIGQDPLL